MLFPLLLAALVPDLLVQDVQRRARVHELQNRLRLTTREPDLGGVVARLRWAATFVPVWAPTLAEICKIHIASTREIPGFHWLTGKIPDTYRNWALEQWISWMARWLKTGPTVLEVPWDQVRRHTSWWPLTAGGTRCVLWGKALTEKNLGEVACPLDEAGRSIAFSFVSGLASGKAADLRSYPSPESLLLPSTHLLESRLDRKDGHVRLRVARYTGTSFSLLWQDNLASVLDWIGQDHPNLSQVSFQEGLRRAATWHEELAKEAARGSSVRILPLDRVLLRTAEGFTVVELREKRSLAAEGGSMGHCVDGYWPKVRDGRARVWSVRDPAGVPRFTLEMDATGRFVLQLYGPENEPVFEVLQRGESADKRARTLLLWTWVSQVPEGVLSRPVCRWFGFPLPVDPEEDRRTSIWILDLVRQGGVEEMADEVTWELRTLSLSSLARVSSVPSAELKTPFLAHLHAWLATTSGRTVEERVYVDERDASSGPVRVRIHLFTTERPLVPSVRVSFVWIKREDGTWAFLGVDIGTGYRIAPRRTILPTFMGAWDRAQAEGTLLLLPLHAGMRTRTALARALHRVDPTWTPEPPVSDVPPSLDRLLTLDEEKDRP